MERLMLGVFSFMLLDIKIKQKKEKCGDCFNQQIYKRWGSSTVNILFKLKFHWLNLRRNLSWAIASPVTVTEWAQSKK